MSTIRASLRYYVQFARKVEETARMKAQLGEEGDNVDDPQDLNQHLHFTREILYVTKASLLL
jgi:hypothetical protein